MADDKQTSDVVTVIPADFSLSDKIGGAKLSETIPGIALKDAENVIVEAADDFYGECVGESARLSALAAGVGKSGILDAAALKNFIDAAFAVKEKAGLSGYDLVAALAASLQLYCENLAPSKPGPTVMQIIDWHAQSMHHLLAQKIKGDGGEAGKAILAEVDKIKN